MEGVAKCCQFEESDSHEIGGQGPVEAGYSMVIGTVGDQFYFLIQF